MPWPGRVEKQPLDPSRLRRIGPQGFSWIDRRFVQAGVLDRLDRDEILLYLFLACVSDHSGLSWWSDRRISVALKLAPEDLDRARARLVERGLIAWRPPLYQVLDLSPPPPLPGRPRSPSPALSLSKGLVGEILRGMTATAPSPEAPASSPRTAG